MKIIPQSTINIIIKYKRIDFAPCNKSIMANKLLSTNLERSDKTFENNGK